VISTPNTSIPTRMSARRFVAGPGAGITGALFALLMGIRHEYVEGRW